MEAVARLSCCYELFGNMIIKREIGNREKLKNGLSFSYYACVGPWEAQASSEIAQSPGLLLLKKAGTEVGFHEIWRQQMEETGVYILIWEYKFYGVQGSEK